MLVSTLFAKAIVKYTISKAAKGEYVNPRPALHAIDELGNDNGHVDLEDIEEVVKEYGQDAVDKLSDIIDFIGDLF